VIAVRVERRRAAVGRGEQQRRTSGSVYPAAATGSDVTPSPVGVVVVGGGRRPRPGAGRRSVAAVGAAVSPVIGVEPRLLTLMMVVVMVGMGGRLASRVGRWLRSRLPLLLDPVVHSDDPV